MKSLKVLTLLIVGLSLFSCGGAEKSEAVEVIKAEPKKEVIKDYDYYMKRIAEDEEWMVVIKEKAIELNISVCGKKKLVIYAISVRKKIP